MARESSNGRTALFTKASSKGMRSLEKAVTTGQMAAHMKAVYLKA